MKLKEKYSEMKPVYKGYDVPLRTVESEITVMQASEFENNENVEDDEK